MLLEYLLILELCIAQQLGTVCMSIAKSGEGAEGAWPPDAHLALEHGHVLIALSPPIPTSAPVNYTKGKKKTHTRRKKSGSSHSCAGRNHTRTRRREGCEQLAGGPVAWTLNNILFRTTKYNELCLRIKAA